MKHCNFMRHNGETLVSGVYDIDANYYRKHTFMCKEYLELLGAGCSEEDAIKGLNEIQKEINEYERKQKMYFREQYAFLSNMYTCKIMYKGITYSNAEAAFQAQKSSCPEIFSKLTGPEAKKLGRTITLPKDWNSKKLDIMYEILVEKFKNPLLKSKLMEIKQPIIENNDWNDTFWGVCNDVGENHLGKLLELVKNGLAPTKPNIIKEDKPMKEVVIFHNDYKGKKGEGFKFSDKTVIEKLNRKDNVLFTTGQRYTLFCKDKSITQFIQKAEKGIEEYSKTKKIPVESVMVVNGYDNSNIVIGYCMRKPRNNKYVLSLKWSFDGMDNDNFGWVKKSNERINWRLETVFFGTAEEYLQELQIGAENETNYIIDKIEEEVGGGYVIKRTYAEWELVEKLFPQYYGGITKYIKYSKVLEGLYNLIREPDDVINDLLELEGHCERRAKGVNGEDGELFHPSYMSYKLWVKNPTTGEKITYRDLNASMQFFNAMFEGGYTPYFHKTYRQIIER